MIYGLDTNRGVWDFLDLLAGEESPVDMGLCKG